SCITPLRFHGAYGNDKGVGRVIGLEFFRRKLCGGQALEERHRGEHVAMAFDSHRAGFEYLGEELACTQRCERPAPVCCPLVVAALADTGKGCEKHAIGAENAVYRSDGSADFIYQMQRLHEDDAVEGAAWQPGAVAEVGHEGGSARS